jgi:hypothetical protein
LTVSTQRRAAAIRTGTLLPALLLSAAAVSAHALDRIHFKGMSEKDFEYVLSAFQQVNVHYLVTENGGSILTSMTKPNPKVNGLTNFGVFMYFNPRDAESARAAYEKTNAGKTQVRSAPATKIIRAQFARRDAGPSHGTHEADFIIFLSLEPRIDVIEHLVSKAGAPLSVKAKDGKDVVFAFMDRSKAVELQSGLEGRGQKADRVGLDEKSFLGFILAQARQGKFVLVQGF